MAKKKKTEVIPGNGKGNIFFWLLEQTQSYSSVSPCKPRQAYQHFPFGSDMKEVGNVSLQLTNTIILAIYLT